MQSFRLINGLEVSSNRQRSTSLQALVKFAVKRKMGNRNVNYDAIDYDALLQQLLEYVIHYQPSVELLDYLIKSLIYQQHYIYTHYHDEIFVDNIEKIEISPKKITYHANETPKNTLMIIKQSYHQKDTLHTKDEYIHNTPIESLTLNKISLLEKSAIEYFKLIDNYDKKNTKFYREEKETDQIEDSDIIAINAFFSDRRAIDHQLEKLERALQARAASRFDSTRQTLTDYEPTKPLKHHKLLSGFLVDWGRANGFNYTKLVSGLLPSDFARVLITGSLFKDKALRGTDHGEWTHFIQWWCLAEQHREKPFLSMSPAQLYRLIGFKLYRGNDHWTNPFEFPSLNNQKAFSVFEWHAHLQSDKFPVLSQLISGRERKEEMRRLG